MTTALLVLVTAPTPALAADIAQVLVGEHLAACGNVLPGVRSIYRWEGEVKDEAEALLILKTTKERLPALLKRVEELHPYEVPEILAVPVEGGSTRYLSWLFAEVE